MTKIVKMRNGDVRRRVLVRDKMSDGVNLNYFKQLKRLSGERFIKRLYKSEVWSRRDRTRFCTKWQGSVRKRVMQVAVRG